MIQFLEFTFQSFWHFVGVWLLLLVFFAGISGTISAFRTKQGPPGPMGAAGMPGPQGPKGDAGVCRCNSVRH